MKWLRLLSAWIMPKYNSIRHCIPAPGQKKMDTAQRLDINMDNLSINPHTGTIMKYTAITNDQTVHHDWKTLDKDIKAGQRNPELTKMDIIVLTDKNLDKLKAMEIKPLWAAGLSITEASITKRGKRGFSKRTISDYYSAFTSALSEAVGEEIS
jgi:hypothetical protein